LIEGSRGTARTFDVRTRTSDCFYGAGLP
jgi:hypothetical protein